MWKLYQSPKVNVIKESRSSEVQEFCSSKMGSYRSNLILPEKYDSFINSIIVDSRLKAL